MLLASLPEQPHRRGRRPLGFGRLRGRQRVEMRRRAELCSSCCALLLLRRRLVPLHLLPVAVGRAWLPSAAAAKLLLLWAAVVDKLPCRCGDSL